MLTETINAQELYCQLQDFCLKNPMEDQWETFKGAIKIWCDCWFGQEPKFELRGDDCLYVWIEGVRVQVDGDGYGLLCILNHHPEGYKDNRDEKWNMPECTIEIQFFDELENAWEGDWYPLV